MVAKRTFREFIADFLVQLTIVEKWELQDVYKLAQQVLQHFIRYLTDDITPHNWSDLAWNEQLAFYVALVQSYSYIAVYPSRPGRQAELSNTTIICGVFFLGIIERKVNRLMQRHYDDHF
ncbi:unnamed protein product, partial [marine sediment metagenome]